jgi:hypothetical protein
MSASFDILQQVLIKHPQTPPECFYFAIEYALSTYRNKLSRGALEEFLPKVEEEELYLQNFRT